MKSQTDACISKSLKPSGFAFTDAYIGAWRPSGKSLMTEILAFENESGRPKYERDERKTL
jgi:hypothetical protein